MKEIVPFDDRVVIRPIKHDGLTEGGIALPENVKESACRAEVIAVGPGRVLASGDRVVPLAKPGDKVIVDAHAIGELFTLNEMEVVMLHESDIAAKIVA